MSVDLQDVLSKAISRAGHRCARHVVLEGGTGRVYPQDFHVTGPAETMVQIHHPGPAGPDDVGRLHDAMRDVGVPRGLLVAPEGIDEEAEVPDGIETWTVHDLERILDVDLPWSVGPSAPEPETAPLDRVYNRVPRPDRRARSPEVPSELRDALRSAEALISAADGILDMGPITDPKTQDALEGFSRILEDLDDDKEDDHAMPFDADEVRDADDPDLLGRARAAADADADADADPSDEDAVQDPKPGTDDGAKDPGPATPDGGPNLDPEPGRLQGAADPEPDPDPDPTPDLERDLEPEPDALDEDPEPYLEPGTPEEALDLDPQPEPDALDEATDPDPEPGTPQEVADPDADPEPSAKRDAGAQSPAKDDGEGDRGDEGEDTPPHGFLSRAIDMAQDRMRDRDEAPDAGAGPTDEDTRDLVRPAIDADQATNLVAGLVHGDMTTSLSHVPYYLYKFSMKMEDETNGHREHGRVWVHTGTLEVEEVPDDLSFEEGEVGHAAQREDKARSRARDALLKRHRRRTKVVHDDAHVTLVETEDVTPDPDSLDVELVGTVGKPYWRVTGDNGEAVVDAVVGSIVESNLDDGDDDTDVTIV